MEIEKHLEGVRKEKHCTQVRPARFAPEDLWSMEIEGNYTDDGYAAIGCPVCGVTQVKRRQFKRCGGCRSVKYCSQICQTKVSREQDSIRP
ncbi:hypothetical protein BCR35DRAFT_309894 [Leucosporidium creatinivorum]|uniref:MYND-type domain-containing protein n=1 Tax=Leucosporidium creatinivorum TaxID=106004 RepID=A0A1Y2DAG3_9BASI|nr:hypothetical protein BCR35DRAFT_309894 [Leucosporidium creatinivorum]